MISLKFWKPKTFEISSHQFNLSERINKSYSTSGSDNTGICTYSYNELGFRGDSIKKEGFKIMSLGCSMTEGVGVNYEHTWPTIFSSLIDNGVNMNFGTGGRSNDFISRCLISYFDLIKPDLVLIMYTEHHRREYYTENGGVEPFHVKRWGYFEKSENADEIYNSHITLSNVEQDFQNWYKNHLLIRYFLKSKNCNFIWSGPHTSKNFIDENKFDNNFFPNIDYGVDNLHPGPLTHKKYATELFEYIQFKFPNFIPNKNKKDKKII
jgi:hypothetical protein